MKGLKGLHHVTAITSSAEKNYEFFTYVLGMRLVKKTVNQDDIQTYHLFFADDEGNAGTDMTFFDFPGIPKGRHGTNELYKTGFRVPSDDALHYWVKRFDRLDVKHQGIKEMFGKKLLTFQDFDEQMYMLVSDEKDNGVPAGKPWKGGPVPEEFAITGLGPMQIRIEPAEGFHEILEKAYGFQEVDREGSIRLFETGEGGNGAQLFVEHNAVLPPAQQGYGTVHHIAFRVEDRDAIHAWDSHLRELGFQTSGHVDRFYFESLYIPSGPQILFELATDGPGFTGDEPYETLGEKLALPPKLEPKREEIEGYVRHIDTVRSTKTIEKEYE
ncbi:ring-cleaving dioxygenase [Alkalicoccus chagannorensis]|uniref:ring-cleaving dioxygenase n=1 Tax=Alkalicoccus chagannorensis TaxID=427072 RepID=UPI00047993DF|nr:ring-cleaving dioxygenase [Alkalicoccus chagannorensis]